MRRILFICAAGISLLTLPVKGQQEDLFFQGAFRDLPFATFAEEVEAQTGVIFYFREEWTRDIRVTLSGERISLSRALEWILTPEGLYFHMEYPGFVFITKNSPLVATLPDYGGGSERMEVPSTGTDTGPGASQQKYIDGRKASVLETIQVGGEEGAGSTSLAVINGRITDAGNGEPLLGATIYFEELKQGTATDLEGHFTMVVRPGRYTVEFRCMGMREKYYFLEVHSDGNIEITLEGDIIALTEVVVQTNRYHNVRGKQMGFDRLNYRILKEVPVVMGERDILKVIQLLPGVQTVGEGASGFNVRGSAADQNMIYMNRVPVYNSSHLFGFFTVFSPDAVKEFTLYKSNLPVFFGGRLASVFDITSQQGNMNQFSAHGGISQVTGRLSVEGPIRKGKSSYLLAGRTTYSDWLLTRLEDPQLRESDASFYDLTGVLTWEPGEKTLIKLFGYYSSDYFKLGMTNRYNYHNTGGTLSLRKRIGQRLMGDLALIYGTYDFTTVNEQVASESWTQTYRIGHHEARIDMSWLSLGNHKLTFGGSTILYRLDRGTVEPFGEISRRLPVELGLENGLESALYLADEIALAPRLTLYGGLRFAVFSALGPDQVAVYGEGLPLLPGNMVESFEAEPFERIIRYSGLDPRVALNLMLGEYNSLKFSYNRVHQFLFMLSNTIAISPSDQWKLCDYNISPPKMDQLSLGFYQDFPRGGINSSLEVYYKKGRGIIEYRDGANFISTPQVETMTLRGEQEAYGFEALFRKNAGRLSGWLSYAYSRSLMTVDSPLPGERINGGSPYPSNFDHPHSLNMVANIKINRRLSFSGNMAYYTGRPVTYPVSLFYVDGQEYLNYASRNSYRIPDYFRIDFSVNIEGNLKERKLFHSYWMLNFYNLTGRSNAYSVFFQVDEGKIQGYKLSIFGRMIVTLSWNFKLGNYASE